ncbi:MAG TPA: hypothetical protein VIV12_23080 [Streptosporangiaceae bacterium]
MSIAHASFRDMGAPGYAVAPKPHPAYDAQWIEWRDESEGVTYVVPTWAPPRIVTLACLKPGSTLRMTRPEDSVVWHPSEHVR